MRRFIFAIALTAFLAVPASADVRIMSSAGGPVVPCVEFFSKSANRASGSSLMDLACRPAR